MWTDGSCVLSPVQAHSFACIAHLQGAWHVQHLALLFTTSCVALATWHQLYYEWVNQMSLPHHTQHCAQTIDGHVHLTQQHAPCLNSTHAFSCAMHVSQQPQLITVRIFV